MTAAEGGEERANVALEWIRQLYAIERDLPALLSPSEEPLAAEQRRQREEQRRQQRQQQATPVLASLKKWLDEQQGQVLPKSPWGRPSAIR